MNDRLRPEDERQRARARPGPSGTDGPAAQADAVFDPSARSSAPARGGAVIGRALGDLQASAGNRAVAGLLDGLAASRRREGLTQVHAARTSAAEAVASPAVQRDTSGGPAPEIEAADDSSLSAESDSAPKPGPSWTHVGPPTRTTYDVSGTLREAAEAVAARPEAGSETATPSEDTETWTPPGGTERVTAARVTVEQVVELPNWTDRARATASQQAEWDRFAAAIAKHEEGHVAIDRTSFAGAHAAMLRKTPAEATKALDAAAAKAADDNDAYDTANDHGRKQGTAINPNIDETTKVP